MNKNRIKQLNKKVDKIISRTQQFTFPIHGGFSNGPIPITFAREVTPQEAEILQRMNLPVPISIALDREKEFLELLSSQNTNI